MSKQRSFQLSEVAIGKMSVNSKAQRELKPHRVKELHDNLDLDMLGFPVLNWVSGDKYHIIDGQHRIEAIKQFLGDGWQRQILKCKVYKALTEQEEADMFDRLNNVLSVSAFAKFKVRITAQREIETEINRIVESEGLKIARGKLPGSISSIGTLVAVFNRTDSPTLGRVLRVLRDSFGDSGFKSSAIYGISLLCERYGSLLNEKAVIERFGKLRGGIGGLLGRAQVLQKQIGSSLSVCVAAAAVDILNADRGASKKLPSWWKENPMSKNSKVDQSAAAARHVRATASDASAAP